MECGLSSYNDQIEGCFLSQRKDAGTQGFWVSTQSKGTQSFSDLQRKGVGNEHCEFAVLAVIATAFGLYMLWQRTSGANRVSVDSRQSTGARLNLLSVVQVDCGRLGRPSLRLQTELPTADRDL
jgi:hypothetical protein